jgi:hypothetical protein
VAHDGDGDAARTFGGFVANKRDVLGTMLRSVLVGHWRYAHMRERGDNP